MPILKVENLSKLYRLGEVGTGTISHDLNRWWARVRGKEDPYAIVGQTNDRSQKAESDYVWALKDINFEVEQGEILGIIGRNGAGKSTLLKILSQITSPTTGEIKTRGRIASLLEVGTGMNPEMTARENIYLNGAILGMTKKEITAKFNEIIDFSGCTMYVDTPLKRFSSGMRVRLGFAVAAFLEPEILIVDEVLAVGDAEFQKKAIGKMKDISSGGGRTVLFVSHNMEAVKSLCKRVILLNKGMIEADGEPTSVIDHYLANEVNSCHEQVWQENEAPKNEWIHMKSVKINTNHSDKQILTVKTPILISFEFILLQNNVVLNLSLHIYAYTGECIFAVTTELPAKETMAGVHTAICEIPPNLLNAGAYYIKCIFVKNENTPIFTLEDTISFEIYDERDKSNWHGKYPGFIRPKLNFKLIKND